MNWIKHALVDIIVTLLIIVAATQAVGWAQWLILGYTAFMLLLKGIAVAGSGTFQKLKQKETGVPGWFYHALYAANVVVTAAAAWWLVAGGWALIWALSFLAEGRQRRPTAAR